MMKTLKMKHPRSSKLIWIFLKIFIRETPIFYLIFSLVVVCIFCVKTLDIYLKFVLNDIIKSGDSRMANIYKLFFMEVFGSVLQELKYLLFLKIYGEHIRKVCVTGFKKIMIEHKLVGDDYDNGVLQNNFQIGCMGLSKLLSVMVLNILPGFIGVFNLLKRMRRDFRVEFCVFIFLAFFFFVCVNLLIIPIELECQMKMFACSGLEKRYISETINNFENIKTCSMEHYEIRRYDQRINMYRKEISRYKAIGHITLIINRFLFSSVKFMILIYYAVRKDPSAPKWDILRILILEFERESMNIRVMYGRIRKYMLDGTYITKYCFDVPKIDMQIQKRVKEFTTEIRFEHLNIFDDKRNYIIKDFNFVISKGDKIAVIGKNGSGKSTLLKALMGVKVFEGKITVDDNEVTSEYGMLFNHIISYMPQKIILFNENIVYNILYGTENRNINDAIKICKKIDIHNNIQSKKDGYFTKVGENGQFLSGGEQKKIILARILLRRPEVLIMDEPFSELDESSKVKIRNLLFSEMANVTLMMTVHEARPLKHFNKFLYIKNGIITISDDYKKARMLLKDKK